MRYPYSDEEMYFDESSKRYILTQKGVLNNIGENLSIRLDKGRGNNVENVVKFFLARISNNIYRYIYAHNTNNALQQAIISKHPFMRNLIKEAMLEQVNYELVNGDLTLYSGVDIRKGQKMEDFQDRAIAPLAKEILDTEIPGVGVAITYQGQFVFPIFAGGENG